jgi:tetratricopeptide (TPR) repeat protein
LLGKALLIIKRLVPRFSLIESLLVVSILVAQPNSFSAQNAIDRLVLRGDDEFKAGHFQAARSCYLSAMAHNANDVAILLKVAKAEAKIGDLDSAIKRARLATQIEPKSVDSHTELARYLEVNRDPKSAELQYERAIDLIDDPKEAKPFESKAIQMLIDLDDLEKADRLSQIWLKANKKDADCHFNRGLVLSQSEKPSRLNEAAKEFKQALALDVDHNSAHYRLGLVYLKLDDKDAAKEELQNFIKGNPTPQELKEAKERIEQL